MKLRVNKKLLLLAATSSLTLSGRGFDSEFSNDNNVKFEYFSNISENNYSEDNLISYSEILEKTLPEKVVFEEESPIVSDGVYVKTIDTVNFRNGASVESEKIGLIGLGTSLKYLGEENGFYKIEYSGVVGYISKDYAYPYDRAHITGNPIKNVYFPADTVVYNEYMESKAIVPKNETAFVSSPAPLYL